MHIRDNCYLKVTTAVHRPNHMLKRELPDVARDQPGKCSVWTKNVAPEKDEMRFHPSDRQLEFLSCSHWSSTGQKEGGASHISCI